MYVHVQVVSVEHVSLAGRLQEELNMLMLVIPSALMISAGLGVHCDEKLTPPCYVFSA